MRSTVGVALVIGLLLLASGVGLAARGDPKRHITLADQKRASAMLLRRSDLGPGFKRKHEKEDDSYCPSDDESDLTVTGDANTPDWERSRLGLSYVSSGPSVYQTLADAKTSWKRVILPATERCLGDQFRGISPTFHVHRRSFPRVAQRAFEYRLSGVLPGSRKVGIYIDLVLLHQSRANVSLAFGSLLRPPTRAYELRLAHVVAKRMQAAMQGS